MPRPKVKPEDRQRCVLACLPCKRLKIRCDAHTPCATCVKRGREEACVYQDVTERKPTHGRRRRSTASDAASQPPRAAWHRDRQQQHSGGSSNVGSPEDSGPQSRTLLSRNLQKLYVGETASLSYLQFVREIVKHRIGTNAFTEGQFSSFMLESDVKAAETADPSNGVFDHVEPVFVQSYLDATSGVLDLFTNDEIFESVDDPDSNLDVACRHLILAIGAQCRGLPPSDLSYAAAAFEAGQKLAFAGFLCDPSQDMVRRFLLMSFYMTAACHRNAAFMYLGIAWKAACALGLHRADQYHRLSLGECVTRLKTWRSLRILDTIVNSILGRSGGTSGMQFDDRLGSLWEAITEPNSNLIRERAVQAAFDLCPFLDELERKGPTQEPAFTEGFLKRLQLWSKSLPHEIRRSTDAFEASTNLPSRESFVGAAHVACMYDSPPQPSSQQRDALIELDPSLGALNLLPNSLTALMVNRYYFAIILSTRRFLTLYLTPSVKDSTSPSPPVSFTGQREKFQDLAHVCLGAAKNMANVGHNALTSERTVNNMCLMKAWIFAAGLLLGFWSFAQCDRSEPELTEAFQRSRLALQTMAAFSPQAGHYYDILTSLGDAIDVHRRKVAEERKTLTSRYVDQVLAFDTNDSLPCDGENTASGEQDSGVPGYGSDTNQQVEWLDEDLGAFLSGSQTPFGASVFEGFPWPADDLGLDWAPFAPFLDDIA